MCDKIVCSIFLCFFKINNGSKPKTNCFVFRKKIQLPIQINANLSKNQNPSTEEEIANMS